MLGFLGSRLRAQGSLPAASDLRGLFFLFSGLRLASSRPFIFASGLRGFLSSPRIIEVWNKAVPSLGCGGPPWNFGLSACFPCSKYRPLASPTDRCLRVRLLSQEWRDDRGMMDRQSALGPRQELRPLRMVMGWMALEPSAVDLPITRWRRLLDGMVKDLKASTEKKPGTFACGWWRHWRDCHQP